MKTFKAIAPIMKTRIQTIVVGTLSAMLMVTAWSPLSTIAQTADLPYSSGSTGADGPLKFRQILYGGRNRHAMVYDTNRHEVVLFGGNGSANDTWVFNGTNWLEKTPLIAPAPRYDHAMAYDEVRQKVIIFGGYNAVRNVKTNETWSWDGTNWNALTPTNKPSPRQGAKMTFDRARGEILLFGGDDDVGPRNDTWSWNGNNWTQITPLATPAAVSADYLSFVYNYARQEAVLFDGSASPSRTWIWNGTNWAQAFPDSKPERRYQQVMAYDFALAKVILFGGYNLNVGSVNDTWSWDGTNWVALSPAMSPSARQWSAIASDSSRKQIILFSGYGQPADTWIWNGSTWNYWSGPSQSFDMTSKPTGIWNFTTIDVPSYVTVYFQKNAGNTPMRWLATGNVTLDGVLNLSGENAGTINLAGKEAQGGPGGFSGGLGAIAANQSGSFAGSPGTGPGGGLPGTLQSEEGKPGKYSSTYGNPYIQPLIGGSGGGGSGGDNTRDGGNGGGAGGAILIASSRDILVNGQILVNGGNGAARYYDNGVSRYAYGGGGSGGAILLRADRISGSGSLTANGGSGPTGTAEPGRIRLEAFYRQLAGATTPTSVNSAPIANQDVTNSANLIITSVAGQNVVQPPSGNTLTPDVVFTAAGPVTVQVSGANIPNGTPVRLRVTTATGVINLPPAGQTNALVNGSATFSLTVPAGIGSFQAFADFNVSN